MYNYSYKDIRHDIRIKGLSNRAKRIREISFRANRNLKSCENSKYSKACSHTDTDDSDRARVDHTFPKVNGFTDGGRK